MPEKYQKDSTEKKRDSISPRTLKIGTNVLNLVYNCKNLKLVRQRKNERERERAWARRVEWKTQSENHCTHHIDLTNESAQPKRPKNSLMRSKECVTCLLAHRFFCHDKKNTHNNNKQMMCLALYPNEEHREKIINFLFCATNQFSFINKCENKRIERKFLELQHRSATDICICVSIKRKFMERNWNKQPFSGVGWQNATNPCRTEQLKAQTQ